MRYRYCQETRRVVPAYELDAPKLRTAEIAVGPGEALASKTLPLNWPYAEKHLPDGTPYFSGMRDVREAMARAKDAGEPVEYHRGIHHIR